MMSGSVFRVMVLESLTTLSALVAPCDGVAVVAGVMVMLLELLAPDDHCLCMCTHSFERTDHHE
jgi:hypothetical protein